MLNAKSFIIFDKIWTNIVSNRIKKDFKIYICF